MYAARVLGREAGVECGDEGRFYRKREKKYEELAWEEVGSS